MSYLHLIWRNRRRQLFFMKIKRKKCSLDFTFLLLSGLIYDNPKEIGLQNKKAVVMNQEYMADDRTIVQAMRKDMDSGFRLLMKCYGGPLYWHIRRMVVVHDDANDVLQEALVRVFSHFSKYDGRNSFRAWIYSIATREALRHLGRRQGKTILSLDDMTAIETAGMEQQEYFDNSDAIVAKLQKAILLLPAKQQLAFNLRYYDELPYSEIAEITGTSAASMKANYHVAKEKIVEYMNNND